MTLRKKMVHGAFWSLMEKAGQQGLSFIVFMVLARLVGPKEYGLANVCFIYFMMTSIVIGIVDGIVSLQIKDEVTLSSLFWTVLAMGLALSLFCIVTAAPLSNLMEQPKLASLLYWFSIIPFLLALSAVPNMLVMKSLNFKVYALRTLVATVVGGAVGLSMALKDFGAYALIGQQITLYVVMNLIIWPSVGWRPRFILKFSNLKQVIRPGFNMLGVNALGFLEQQLPRLFIGRFLGPSSLGYYAFVIRLRIAMQEILIVPPLAVLYPAFAEIKHDKKEQQAIAAKMVLFSGITLFPALAIAAATAPLYVTLLFGKAWEPSIFLLQIYILGTFYIPLSLIIRELFRTHNRLGFYLRMQAIVVFLELGMTFLLLLPNGLVLMALGIVSVWFVAIPVYILLLWRWLGIRLWEDVGRLWPSATGALLSYGAIYFMGKSGFHPGNGWLYLLSALVTGGAVYLLSCFILQYRQTAEVVAFARKFSRKKSKWPAAETLALAPEAEL